MNQTMPMPAYHHIRQFFFFGAVGTLAASVHMAIVITLVSLTGMHPLIANIIAFSCSFNISYFGHRKLTFAETKISIRLSLPKFLTVALTGFTLNETLFFFLLKIFVYPIALIIAILLTAACTFFLSKLWAFR